MSGITSEQVRAARALLRWEQKDLAAASGISLPAIKRMETIRGTLAAQARSIEAIVAAFEKAGVEFTDGGQPGVRVTKEYVAGDYAKASEFGRPEVTVGRNHTGKIKTTIEVGVGKKS